MTLVRGRKCQQAPAWASEEHSANPKIFLDQNCGPEGKPPWVLMQRARRSPESDVHGFGNHVLMCPWEAFPGRPPRVSIQDEGNRHRPCPSPPLTLTAPLQEADTAGQQEASPGAPRGIPVHHFWAGLRGDGGSDGFRKTQDQPESCRPQGHGTDSLKTRREYDAGHLHKRHQVPS